MFLSYQSQTPGIDLGAHTIKSHGAAVARNHMHDWLILLLLVVIEVILFVIHPFYRYVGKDMMTDLKYPMKGNTVPSWAVPVSIFSVFVSLPICFPRAFEYVICNLSSKWGFVFW